MSTDNRLRQPAGTAVGGQFAPDLSSANAAPVVLADSFSPPADVGSGALSGTDAQALYRGAVGLVQEDEQDNRPLSTAVAQERLLRADRAAEMFKQYFSHLLTGSDDLSEHARRVRKYSYDLLGWRNQAQAEAVAMDGEPIDKSVLSSPWFAASVEEMRNKFVIDPLYGGVKAKDYLAGSLPPEFHPSAVASG